MFLFELVALYLALYAILVFTGLGLSNLVCVGVNRQYVLLLSPLVGIVPLCIIPMYSSVAGLQTEWPARITFAAFSILSVWQALTKWPKTNWRMVVGIVCLMLISIIPAGIILMKAGYLTSTLQSYGLFVTTPADYLVNHPFRAVVDVDYSKPISNLLHEVLHNREYFGPFFLVASVSALMGIPAFKIYLLLSSVASSLLPISIFIACKEGFKFANKPALLTAFLCTINYSFYVWHVFGQLPMALGLAYLILAMGFLPAIFRCTDKRDIILYSLLIVGSLSNYWILSPYLFFTGVLVALIDHKSIADLRLSIKSVLQIALLVLIINPFTFIFLALRGIEILKITAQFSDNISRTPYLEELFGFAEHFSANHGGVISITLPSIIALAAFGLSLVGLYRCYRDRNVLLLSVACLLLMLIGFFLFTGHKYHVYKNAIVGTFALIALMVAGLDWLHRRQLNNIAQIGLMCFLTAFIYLDIMAFTGFALFAHPLIDKSLMGLEQLTKNIPQCSTILVDSNNPSEEAWMAFFLRDHQVKLSGAVESWGFWILAPFSGHPVPDFFVDPTRDSIDYTAARKNGAGFDIITKTCNEVAWSNDDYMICNALPTLYLAGDWSSLQADSNGVFRQLGKQSSVVFNRSEQDLLLKFQGVAKSYDSPPAEVSVFLNEELIDQFFWKPAAGRLIHLKSSTLQQKTNQVRLTTNTNRIYAANGEIAAPVPGVQVKIKSLELLPINSASADAWIDVGNADYDAYLMSGWLPGEKWDENTDYRWVGGAFASLYVPVVRSGKASLELRMLPFCRGDGEDQKIIVHINGRLIEDKSLDCDLSWKPYRFEIPTDVLKSGLNLIEFEFAFAAAPADVFPNNNDWRKLSAAFDYIKIFPTDLTAAGTSP